MRVLHLLVAVCAITVCSAVHLPPIYPKDSSAHLKDGDVYEFIVAGAGAAGCAVAGRLSERGARVLLLEAGADPDIRSRVPSLSTSLLASDVDWNYKTLPNGKSCLASTGKQCSFSRGKVLGGSTAINYMMYVRGNRLDYDGWNITGWAWDDLEPYFLKFEGLKDLDKLPASSAKYHNTSGPMEVEFFEDSENSWHERILDGYQALNFQYNYDVNAESQIGVSQVIGYVNDGERESSARGYLAPAALRSNLVVAKRARVISVVLDDNNVARGVRVELASGRRVELLASKEVILSTGAIGTPQILMLSGIGPRQHLEEAGITPRVDLPVGEGLRDHVLPLVILQVNRGFGVNFPNLIPFLDDGADLVKWLVTQSGRYASNGLTDLTAFVNTACYDFENHRMGDDQSDECQLPTLQFIHAYLDRDIVPTVEKIFAKSIGLNDDTVQQMRLGNVNYAYIVLSPTLLTPKSRGWVRVNTSEPLAPPTIYANYLGEEEDVDELLKAIRIVEDLLETAPFKRNGARILRLKFEACSCFEWDSDEFWRCYIRQMTHSVYHGMCTTALGRVVDEKLRVYGVRRLRVADGGVMVDLPRGNTAAACIAIGEKAADLISRKYRLKGKGRKKLLNLVPAAAESLTSAVL